MPDTIQPGVDIPPLLTIAETAARRAGAYLLQKLGTAQVTGHKSTRDDLLDADLEAERLLLTTLREATPQMGILSEEAGQTGPREQYWIVDPLDGSANFQHGSPFFGIAIALVVNAATVGGLIYLPSSNELFTAIQGQGAFLNSTPIHVSQTYTLDAAIAHVGDLGKEGDIQIIQQRLTHLSALALHTRRIRMIGSAALDLAYVACGRADLLVNHATAPWDIEAGKLLLQEAGGKTSMKPLPKKQMLCMYSNGVLSQAVEALLGSP